MRTSVKLSSLVLGTALLGGCAFAGAGAAVLQGAGIPTNTAASAAPSAGPATAVNKASAGKPVDKVTVNQNDMRILPKKMSKASATVSYLDGSKDGDVLWSSKDSTIVSVNPTTGEISGVTPGTATVYARAASDPDNKFAIINVTVAEGEDQDLLAEITPAKASIGIGETVDLDASLTKSSTKTSPNGSWTSSNQQVAFVNPEGIVTGRKAGSVTIKFTSDENSTVSATAKITVTDGEEETED